MSIMTLPGVAAAQRGSLIVHVTDRASVAIAQAQVSIVGTTLGGLTNADGRVTIGGVPAGSQQIRVLRIGYGEQKKTVTVAAGSPQTVEIQVSSVAITLTPVVSTATGQTRRLELGNSISTVDAAAVAATSPVSNLADMLNSRAPGVTITSGTQAGTGSRVRIRGINSVSLSNEPIYVIDGVRMTSNPGSAAFGTGGNGASRVGDLNPEEIENIEVVKGPSAATLYGTDAANGVIVITTKKGRAGAARWSLYGEGGIISDRNDYPTNYSIWGKLNGATSSVSTCVLSQLSSGACVKDSLTTYTPFHDPDATPLGTGYRSQYGVQVSGGSEVLRYFLSAENEKETGVLKLPDFETRRFDSTRTPLRAWTNRPNISDRNSVRANLNATINPKLDVGITTNLIMINQRYSLESNATAGLGSQAFGGPGYKNNGTVSGTGTPLNGYRAWTPGYTWQEKTGQLATRFIAGANISYRPFSWNVTRLNIGNDYTSRVDDNFLYKGEGPPITSTYRLGFKGNGRAGIRNFSIDGASSADFKVKPWLLTKTTAGIQYVEYNFNQNIATGTDLVPGSQTTGGGATKNATEATTFQKTAGFFLEEQLSIRDRLFLTAAARSDQNSAFGTDFQRVIYPKFSASWVLSEEDFMPSPSWLDNLRLRAALGSSGVQPGPNDALRFYQSAASNIRLTDVTGAIYAAIGNDNLKPERTTELETGFDLRMFRGRLNVEATFYNKNTKDALVAAIVPPSLGAANTQASNLGAVNNHGYELLLNSVLVDHRALALDMTISGSTNSNKVKSLGNTPAQIGTTTRVVAGYPINGFWAQPITGWDDKNKDGILTYNANPALNEVFVGDSAIFRGYSQPRYVVTATNGLELFNKRLRFQSLLDYRGGHLYYNNTERIRCVSRRNCNGLVNPSASLEEQAMVVATLDNPAKTLDGFFQSGAFVRLRELSATYTAGSRVARLARARTASITLTARNLGRYTKYRGVDPETDRNASVDSDSPEEFQTIAPPSYFVLRFNFGY
ncbi:MAG: SusC/RagA family TonB-linked outer membrane protein [Gemmatimonadaceae bacterium]